MYIRITLGARFRLEGLGIMTYLEHLTPACVMDLVLGAKESYDSRLNFVIVPSQDGVEM